MKLPWLTATRKRLPVKSFSTVMRDQSLVLSTGEAASSRYGGRQRAAGRNCHRRLDDRMVNTQEF